MPGRDGTGPMGQGTATGRGMGNCAPKQVQQDAVYGRGRGGIPYGCGRGNRSGGGRGRFIGRNMQNIQSNESTDKSQE